METRESEPVTGGGTAAAGDQPPSYDSIYGRLKKAKHESGGNVEFARRAVGLLLCGTVVCGIYSAFLLAIPIAMIVIGALYLDQCPRERFIPIYLLVGGSFGVFKAVLNVLMECRKRRDPGTTKDGEGQGQEQVVGKPNPLEALLTCFLLAWFIAGNVWVYRVYADYQWTEPSLPNYCHHTLYLFAFWLLTLTWVLAGLSLLCGCLGCLAACCFISQ